MIKALKSYSKDIVNDSLECEKSHQKLLWDIIENPWVIKYVKRYLLKKDQKKIWEDL